MGNSKEDFQLVKSLLVINGMNEVYIEEFDHIQTTVFARHNTKRKIKELIPDIQLFIKDWYDRAFKDKDKTEENNRIQEYHVVVNLVQNFMDIIKSTDRDGLAELLNILNHYKNDVRIVTDDKLYDLCEEFRKYGKLGMTKEQAMDAHIKNYKE